MEIFDKALAILNDPMVKGPAVGAAIILTAPVTAAAAAYTLRTVGADQNLFVMLGEMAAGSILAGGTRDKTWGPWFPSRAGVEDVAYGAGMGLLCDACSRLGKAMAIRRMSKMLNQPLKPLTETLDYIEPMGPI